MENNEIVLRVGAEGGSLTLYGVRAEPVWLSSLEVIDQTPLLLNELRSEHRTKVLTSWPQALELLDDTYGKALPTENPP